MRIFLLLTALIMLVPLSAQYAGGEGEGSDQRQTVQLDLSGVPGGIRPLYVGGRGDGSSRSLTFSGLNSTDQPSMGLYRGGIGDGYAKSGSLNALNGTDLSSIFGGGQGDGADQAKTAQSLGGVSVATLYGGGQGDGYANLRNSVSLGGEPTSSIFSGGDGDGADRLATTSLLGAPMTMLYGGGNGDGFDRRNHYGTLNDQDLSVAFLGGAGDGHDRAIFYGSIPLPLTLLSFDAFPQSDYVLVKWTTEDEIGTDFFTVEKTRDGRNFAIAGELPAAGFSEPEEILHYELKDEAPYSGTSFYRLQTTDFDGALSFSHLVQVEFSSGKDWDFQLFPNPNSGRHFSLIPEGIEEGQRLDVAVTDAVGRVLFSAQMPTRGVEALRFDLDGKLPPGSYLIRVGHPQKGYRAKILLVGGRP